ncbi:hypothetical protein AVEN_135108-1 [Araneus ventricosus]|uniref:Uncharacterized protein n=1 Tax=Araneus ventricosus TaxID=182803 RepID=A0A4Y2JMB3_ARAVE|nr:hypothetical protein AVEN_135108-1 [Araneus ventricosus]
MLNLKWCVKRPLSSAVRKFEEETPAQVLSPSSNLWSTFKGNRARKSKKRQTASAVSFQLRKLKVLLGIFEQLSRLSCYEDVLKRLFLSSDPVLTSMRPTMRKKSKSFLKETLEMFLPMESSEVLDEEDSDHEETDNDINDLSSDE